MAERQTSTSGEGDDAADLIPEAYDELRALAAACLQGERVNHTLQPTALVNEAYLRLAKLDKVRFSDRAKFFAAAASTIRRVLVDHARARASAKRGGGWQRLTLSGLVGMPRRAEVELLALEDALARLAALDAGVARVVELRYFGGLTIEETARMLDTGVTTVKDRWEFARAWLRRELGGGEA